MVRGLKILGTLVLLPFAVAAFLVLMIAAVLWYYIHTLAYFGWSLGAALFGLRRTRPGSGLSGPHFAERSTHKISVD